MILSPATGIVSFADKVDDKNLKISIKLNGGFSKNICAPCDGVIQNISEVDEANFQMQLLTDKKLITFVGKKDDFKNFYLMPGDKVKKGGHLLTESKASEIHLLFDFGFSVNVKEGDLVKSGVSVLAKTL